MALGNKEVYNHAKKILAKNAVTFSYGMFMLLLLAISRDKPDASIVNDYLIQRFAEQLSGDEHYQNIFFHAIKNGFNAIPIEQYEAGCRMLLSTLLMAYSRLNCITYEQAIINLQNELKKILGDPSQFILADNFFMRTSAFATTRLSHLVHASDIFNTTPAFNKFNRFWSNVYDEIVYQYKKHKKAFKQAMLSGLSVMTAIIVVYFSQFRDSQLSDDISAKEPPRGLFQQLSINWHYLIPALISGMFFIYLLAQVFQITVTNSRGSGSNTLLHMASKFNFYTLFLTVFKIDLWQPLLDSPGQPEYQKRKRAPIAIVLTTKTVKKVDEKKLLEYEPLPSLLLNPNQNIYSKLKPKHTLGSKYKLSSFPADTEKKIAADKTKIRLEAIEWHIKELDLIIKLFWDPETKQTYQFNNPTQPSVIKYVSNPEGIKYFCYIPYQTIVNQYDEKTFLDAIKNVVAQPSSDDIRVFTDGVSRSAQVIAGYDKPKHGKAEKQEEELTPNKQSNAKKIYRTTMNLTFEILLPRTDRILGNRFKAKDNKSLLAFAPVFFAEGAHTTEKSQKMSFGKVILADKDIEEIAVKQQIIVHDPFGTGIEEGASLPRKYF